MTATAELLRDAVQPPPPEDGPRGLPGATCREIGGHRVWERDGQLWLSSTRVLAIMGIGVPPPSIPAGALEYTRKRGVLVGDSARLWVEAGRPDASDFARVLDDQLAPWRETAGREWSRFSLVPYLAGLEQACVEFGWTPTEAEVLVEDADTKTFGFADLVGSLTCEGGHLLEIKTSKTIRLAHRLQTASYGGVLGGTVVRLDKDGRCDIYHTTEDEYATFAALARCAREWVSEQT